MCSSYGKIRLFFFLILGSTLLIVYILNMNSVAQQISQPYADVQVLVNYVKSNFKEVVNLTRELTQINTRYTGYPGYYETLQLLKNAISELGFNPKIQTFQVPIPYENYSRISIGNRTYAIYALEPNLIALSVTPREGISGKLIWAGDGNLSKLKPEEIKDSIVVMDYNSFDRWIDMASFGAKAVIFVKLDKTTYVQSMSKFLSRVPLYFPRFFADNELSDILISDAKERLYARIDSQGTWLNVNASNIMVRINGTTYPNDIIILTTHIDSYSPIPRRAPGAEEAVSIASLIQLMKFFKEHPPQRTILFLLTSGHYQGLAGMRAFIEKYIFEEPDLLRGRPRFLIELQFHSDSDASLIQDEGSYLGSLGEYPATMARFPAIIGLAYDGKNVLEGTGVREYYSKALSLFNYSGIEYYKLSPEELGNIINNILVLLPTLSTTTTPGDWQLFAIGDNLLEITMFRIAGGIGFALTTGWSYHKYWCTPDDTFEEINWKNIAPQFLFSLCFVNYIQGLDQNTFDTAIPSRSFHRVPPDGFGKIVGKVVAYDARKDQYVPVGNALVAIYPTSLASESLYVGASRWHTIFVTSDENGNFEVDGLVSQISYRLRGFKLNESGSIIMAPDMGSYGAGKYPQDIQGIYTGQLGTTYSPYLVTVFNSSTLTIFGGIYNNFLQQESYITTDSFSIFTSQRSKGLGFSSNEVTVAFLPPESRVIAISNQYFIINNSIGISLKGLGEDSRIYFSQELALDSINKTIMSRYNVLHSYLIGSSSVDFYFDQVKEFTNNNMKYLSAGQELSVYAVLIDYLYKAYVEIQSSLYDVASSGIFFFALLIPFTLIFQQVFFPAGGVRRIFAIVIVFLIFSVLFYLLHPGMILAQNSIMLVIGVAICATAIPMILIVFEQLGIIFTEFREKALGRHEIRMRKSDLLLLSVEYSLGYIKKRPLRMALTMTTIIIIIASMVFLVSVEPSLLTRQYPSQGVTLFDGLQIVSNFYSQPISPGTVELINDLFGKEISITYRLWSYAPGGTGRGFPVISGTRFDDSIRGYIGISTLEANYLLKGKITGNLFINDSEQAIILPSVVANRLGVSIGDEISFLGVKLRLIGTFENLSDIVDFTQYGYLSLKDLIAAQQNPKKFLSSEYVALIPVKVAEELNGKLPTGYSGIFVISCFSKTSNYQDLLRIAKLISVAEPELYVYVGYKNSIYLIQGGKTFFVQQLNFFVIPLIISLLILLDVGLQSVYERTKEIGTMSALGLDPSTVTYLYFSENVSYALLSTTIGYLLALLIIKLSAILGLTIYANYSSLYVILSIGLSGLIILATTAYPSFKASKLITPSLERRWKIQRTATVGDTIEIDLPFTYTSTEEARAVLAFLKEYLEAHKDERVGNFVLIGNAELKEVKIDNFPAYILSGMAHISPYEAGLNQEFQVVVYRDNKGTWHSKVISTRKTGGQSEWVRASGRFVYELRNQFLTWRGLSDIERRKYYSSTSVSKGG